VVVSRLPGRWKSHAIVMAGDGSRTVRAVFLHLLPGIVAGNEAIGKALSDVVEPTALLDLAICVAALAVSQPSTARDVRRGGRHRAGWRARLERRLCSAVAEELA
jgi:hypothetical protein